VLSLAGIYGVAFLSVMTVFGLSNLILRQSRSELKRTYRAPLIFVSLATLLTFLAIIGNLRIDAKNLGFFEIYFIPAVIITLLIVYQDQVLQGLMVVMQRFPFLQPVQRYLENHSSDILGGRFVAFVHHSNKLHQILDYINRNETGTDIILVHCAHANDPATLEFERLKNILPVLQEVGVFSHFKLTLVYRDEEFSPEMIDSVSEEFHVRRNRIMIGTIDEFQEFNYEYVGGTRIIL
jgi:hypothetical protein